MRISKRGKTSSKTGQRGLAEGGLPTGLAAPARRALAEAGIQRLEQLARFSEDEIKGLHGIGPNAITVLRRALASNGMTFKRERR